MKNNRPELLAPVNLNTLETAVTYGADAVYLGGDMFSARKNAKNFTLPDLESAIDYCHLHDTKAYLTVNTLISDAEMQEFYNFVYKAASMGIDAFIVQDIGVASLIKKYLPEVPLHASTQMTVHNVGGARMAKEFGFKRVVLARELSKSDIKMITGSCGIETEVFVHGALCVSYSGQCLLSSLVGGRSGNRGACAQPCRLPYKLFKDEHLIADGYLLNTKDLSIAKNVPELIEMGVSSFKIEGRMKDEKYVAASVSVFRKCIDNNVAASEDDMAMLENAFSRGGFTAGHYGGASLKSMMRINQGNNDVFDKKVFLDKFDEQGRKLPVDIDLTAVEGQNLQGVIKYKDFVCKRIGDIVETAAKKTTEKEIIVRQLNKLGDTAFEAKNLSVQTSDNIFLPLKSINELRRDLTGDLESCIVNSYKRTLKKHDLSSHMGKTCCKNPCFTVQVYTENQYNAVLNGDFKYIFLPVHLMERIKHKYNIVYVFPDIIQNSRMEYYTVMLDKLKSIGARAVMSGNYAIISLASERGFKVFGSSTLNIFNSRAVLFWQEFGLVGGVLSNELRLNEISAMQDTGFEKIINIYGHITAMQTAYCPISASAGKCDCRNGNYILKDRKNESFAILKSEPSSACKILNSKPIYMADRLDEAKQSGCECFNFLFTTEDADECKRILEMYRTGIPFDKPFTRGHFYRGIT